MTQPASVPADGNLKVAWVETLADPAAPTVTELTAGTVVDLTCYLTADGFTPSTEEQVISDDRLCSRQTYEQPGRYTDGLEISYVHNLPSATDNDAYDALTHLNTGYIVARWDVPYETAFAAADVVDVYPATAGVQRKQPPEANSVMRVTQRIFITGAVQRDVAVVA